VTSCTRCGGAREPGSEYCVECGQPFRTPTRAQALWNRYPGDSVWPILAVLLLAALGALVAIAVSRGDDGPQTLVATNLPARTTVRRVPIFGTAPAATTVPPIVPTVAPPPTTTGPKTTTLTTWTLADGYTLVLASIPQSNGRASAVQIAKQALAKGLPQVGILDSKDFAGLHPGYYVVFSGVYESNAEAAQHVSQAETAGFTSPYTRQVTR
jgi:hypothetical protein